MSRRSGSRQRNIDKTAGRSVLSPAFPGTMGQPPASKPRPPGGNSPPWLAFPARDAAYVVLLLFVTTLAWCSANAKWTAGAWSQPTAYLEPAKGDVFSTLAHMK